MAECVTPSALYDVTVTLDRVTVHDSCDNASPGDWKMIFSAKTTDMGVSISPWIQWWPDEYDTKNVSDGNTYRNPKKSIKIYNIHADKDIELKMNGIDCDGDFLLDIASWESFLLSVIDPFDNAPKFHCEGEEINEFSGNHDRLGKARTILPGDTSVVEYMREFQLKGAQNNQCADKSVYTAYFQVSRTKAGGIPPPKEDEPIGTNTNRPISPNQP
jgi:hypothetical protein